MGFELSLRPDIVTFYRGRRMPRGVRNNNPGNIRLSKSAWLGLCDVQADSAFCQFATAGYGLRAMAVLLRNYVIRDHCVTISDVIKRWAPPEENNTLAYISDVCKRAMVDANDRLDVSTTSRNLAAVVQAICEHENGAPLPYAKTEYEAAIILAGGGT